MNLRDFKYQPFSAGLKSSFKNSCGTIDTRDGFIISISGEMKRISYGEVSPLPGFSHESLTDAALELAHIKELAPEFEKANDIPTLIKFFDSLQFSPSVRFGMEQAMIGMLLKRDRSLLAPYMSKTKSMVLVNAVIDMDNNALSNIKEKIRLGYSTFKIKIGRRNFSEDLELINNIRSQFGNQIKLRLDANGKWSLEESKSNLEKLHPYEIEYIEEPCAGIEDLTTLSKISPLQIAADESIKNIQDAFSLIEQSLISFIIIKPMILGGFFRTSELISKADLNNKNIIISSAFETPIGKSMLVLLAAMTKHNYAHGLDTGDFFKENMFNDPYKVEYGGIKFSSSDYPPLFYGRVI